MRGYVNPGPSDHVWYWLQEQKRPIDYLEIVCGGESQWSVHEIIGESHDWREVRLEEWLGRPFDRFEKSEKLAAPAGGPSTDSAVESAS